MKLTFLGTRGEIKPRSRRHYRHTATLVGYGGRRVLIDCGADWRGHVAAIRPHAIVITHAHPDHAFGLADGAPCPVYATEVTWAAIGRFPITERRVVQERRALKIEGIRFEAFGVEHSIRAPAVGYRASAGNVTIFYVPDLVYIHERAAALRGVRVYVGDGASLTRPIVRRRGDRLFGHAPVSTQLGWCQKEGVPRAIITHCGSQITNAPHAEIVRRIAELGEARGVRADVAWDGLEVVLR